jgi:enediyne biosynthesis protein E4
MCNALAQDKPNKALENQNKRVFAWPPTAAGFLCGITLAMLGGCSKRSEPAAPQASEQKISRTYSFQDITESAGISAIYDNGEAGKAYSILESLGGGLGVLDFDLDGRWDIWFPQGGQIDPANQSIQGHASKLFRRQADSLAFSEVGNVARIDWADKLTHGCSIADYDNDGFSDVLITGYGGLQFYRNLGDGTFEQCAQSVGLTDTSWSSSAGFGDFDRNGFVDLYVTHYVDWSWDNDPKCHSPPPEKLPDVCTPTRFQGLSDVLYLNDGQGGFIATTQDLAPGGKGLGVILADFDQNAGVDIYVANDTTENFLYSNQGDGRFTETGLVSGSALDHRGTPNGSMGLAVLDFDLDQQPDLWVTNFENETFCMYRNQSGGNFQCITERTGITAIGSVFVGFGTSAMDVELDGDEDLVVSNGHVQLHPPTSSVAQHPLLLLNDGRGRLIRSDMTTDPYFGSLHRGRSVVHADFDGDGMCDLVFSHVQEPASLLLNRCQPQGNWLSMQLVGRSDNRNAIGAQVDLTAGGRTMIRQIVGGGGYLSAAPYTLHWGIPGNAPQNATPAVQVKITWPNGQVQELRDLPVGQQHLIVQP